MSGVILETLSNRKLITIGVILLLVQIAFYLIGGLIAPSPSNVQPILATKCIDTGKHRHKTHWFYPRGKHTDKICENVDSFEDKKIIEDRIEANQIVFSFQFPLPREGRELDMSRWFQNIISVIQVDVDYQESNPMDEKPMLTLDARLGYRDNGTEEHDWTEIAQSIEERKLECDVEERKTGHPMRCSLLPFFELGTCHHDYYLVNIRLPVHIHKGTNMGIGKVQDLWLIEIHQNGGFTKVWLSVKTVMFPVLLAAIVFFWRRITQLQRSPNLLERTLFILGLALSLLNLPLEYLTLWVKIPFMLLLTDIRQGIFYATLMCFWIIFCGEHMMDQIERNRLVIYWKHLSAVVFGCVCLFVFEMCERGVQLRNPFYSIWVTEFGANLALAFIIIAGICAGIYFIFLCYMIFRVFRNISAKKSALPAMGSAKRKYFQGLIYRFKFLMLTTLLSAAVTVIFFIVSHVSEGHWKWGEQRLEYTSAFFIGVYGMWNLYVIGLLILYAPSHKYLPVAHSANSENTEETIEFESIQGETSRLAAFVTKAAAD